MRFTVYTMSPYPWELQFAATSPRELLRPVASSDVLDALKFAATLWAKWFAEDAFIFDNAGNRWVFGVNPHGQIQGVQIQTPAIRPQAGAAGEFGPPVDPEGTS